MGKQNDDEGSRIVPDCGQGKLHPPKRIMMRADQLDRTRK
jgi:hypothetical protein